MNENDRSREPTPKERARASFYADKWLIPLLHLEDGQLTARVRELAEQEWEIPHSRRRTVSEATIWRLLKIYREHGLSALFRKPRSNAGQPQRVPRHILARAIEIRADLSSRSMRRVMKVLEHEYPLEMRGVKPSTLSRALTRAGHPRVRPRRRADTSPQKARHIHMRWERPLQLVQSDVCGQTLWVMLDGELIKISLIAILDHCSKLCLHAEWFVSANVPAMEKCIVQALLAYGIFERLHVDRGKIFACYVVENICKEMKIDLKYARAYYPAGKGGIERFWQTAAEFIREIGDSTRFTLDEVNRRFLAWLHEYNHTVHSETGEAPLERYERLVGEPPLPDPVKLRHAAMLREPRTVDKRFSCVHVRCKEFSVDPSLRGKRVEVRYDPFVLDEVLIYDLEGTRLLQRATPTPADEKPAPFLPSAPAHPTPSIDVFPMLEQQRARDLHVRPPRPVSSTSSKAASFAAFCQQVGRLLMRESDLDSLELELLRECWQRHGPFEPGLISQTLDPLITHIGHRLHVAEYLNALISAHLTQTKE